MRQYMPGDLGRKQVEGEFVSMTGLCKARPDLVPRPIAWGKLKSVSLASRFLLVEFKDFTPVGRSVKPVLIHGDMWDGNVGTVSATSDAWSFDSAAYYAHDKMELGCPGV
ncbi:hypothetical protein ACO1O0_003858 [Amphichorda felina]